MGLGVTLFSFLFFNSIEFTILWTEEIKIVLVPMGFFWKNAFSIEISIGRDRDISIRCLDAEGRKHPCVLLTLASYFFF